MVRLLRLCQRRISHRLRVSPQPRPGRGKWMAWVLDAYPEERASHARELRRRGLLVGEFPTEYEAWDAVHAALMKEKDHEHSRSRRAIRP
jgi:hypothetical protein